MASRLNRRSFLKAGAAATGALAVPAGAGAAIAGQPSRRAAGAAAALAVTPWPAADAILANTKVPTFPARNFNVLEYGAKADNSTDNTAAFKRAVDACAAAGGGHVVVPAGTYVTGAIHLRSNVDFHLEGATLRFSGDASKFPTVLTRYEGIECMNRSPMVYAYKQTNIGLTGRGTLDARTTSSWNKGNQRSYLESLVSDGVPPERRVVPGSGRNMRSTFIEPYSCDTVLIQGVTLRNSMFWQVHPTLCKNVTVDGVSTDANTDYNNTDGCDPESCDHVVIKNCNLGAHDDNVAIKSGRDADGRRINVPCQNIVVMDCVMNGNWGAITCGSEQTGGIRNVYAYRLTIRGETKYALYVKSNTRRGGFSENVNIDSFSGPLARSVAFVNSTYNDQTGSYPPRFGPFTITNSSCTRAGRKAFDVSGLGNSHVRGFTVQNCDFRGVSDTSNRWSNVDDVRFTNVKINGRTVPR
jgi:polygalacturonase